MVGFGLWDRAYMYIRQGAGAVGGQRVYGFVTKLALALRIRNINSTGIQKIPIEI
jgi:hypothetical protein